MSWAFDIDCPDNERHVLIDRADSESGHFGVDLPDSRYLLRRDTDGTFPIHNLESQNRACIDTSDGKEPSHDETTN